MMILPDLLERGLKVVFCGTAPGNISAKEQAYYAAASNKFWKIIFKAGIIPYRLQAQEFEQALRYGVGFTDLAKHESGVDKELSKEAFDRSALYEKILTYQPTVLAFTSKRAAQEFFGYKTTAQLKYGRQKDQIGLTTIFVLPSPSAAAIRWWQEEPWFKLGLYLQKEN
ncbi:MAG TPA: mismatch-specific DNA-glycosylase [Candidatus Avacidaminococcus intestinavium]|uniref:Mismatch-specific DNA-glycosylase n=1 Tax=Candidatus Avacidaminococcus intestinavium TaxID=2840684 RepID=A0A9D1MP04_9FIRM|nr:mismatch-specific DNA-glycosylase [Candidatus Avacidaminococcus intestinavium]